MRAFNEIPFYDFQNKRIENIIGEIKSKGKEYIITVDEDEYINSLYNNYILDPLKVFEESEFFDKPSITTEKVKNEIYSRGEYNTDVYTFNVIYNFTGSGILFKVSPSKWVMRSYDILVNDSSQTVSFSFKMYAQDPDEFKRKKADCYRDAFTNIDNLNEDVIKFNDGLKDSIKRAFQKEKDKYLKENNFFEAINLKVNPNTKSVFSVPEVNKKIVPQPTIAKNKEFSSEPTISIELYHSILQVIYDFGKSMERKPSTYIGKDEEGLRDQFLLILETRYEGTTATGETFNRSGKADMILKYSKDGSNLFVAECKFWRGSSEFLKAISQLFERYLTWRDSKVALLIFVKSKDFSNVLDSIKNEIKNHSLFIKEIGERGESSFSYLFSLPQDKNKHIYFEVIAFHYDK